jgi:hypothetical protein
MAPSPRRARLKSLVQQERREEALRAINEARDVLTAAAVDADLIVHAPQVRAWLVVLGGWQVEGAGAKRVLLMAREARTWLDTLDGWRAEVRQRDEQQAREEAARRARAERIVVRAAAAPEVERAAAALATRSTLAPADPSIARRAFDGLDIGPFTVEVRQLAEHFATLSPAEWLATTNAQTPAAREALEQALVDLMDMVPEARTWWDSIRAGSGPIAAQAATRYAKATGEQKRTLEHVRSVNTWEGSREMVRAEPLPPFEQRRFRDTLEYALAALIIRPVDDTDRRSSTS